MTIYEHLLYEESRLTQAIVELKEALKHCPPGNLICQKNGSRYKYYQQILPEDGLPRSEYGVKIYLRHEQMELIHALARKAQWKRKLKECEQELQAVRAYLRIHRKKLPRSKEKILQSEGFSRLLIPTPPSLSEELQQWQCAEYPRNPGFSDGLCVPSVRGEMVRSKSEAFIAYSLYNHGIPFRYECLLKLPYHELYPDFTLRHPDTGQIIIWEHFGMMHDPSYVRSASDKIKTYVSNGYIPNKTLIMTFESEQHPFNVQEVDFIIEHFILGTAM